MTRRQVPLPLGEGAAKRRVRVDGVFPSTLTRPSATLSQWERDRTTVELRQRIRDVRQGPDGLLYVLTDQQEGAVLRIEPAD